MNTHIGLETMTSQGFFFLFSRSAKIHHALNIAVKKKIKSKKLVSGWADCGHSAGLWRKVSIKGKDFPNQDEWVISSSGMTNEGWSVASVLWRPLGSLSPITPDPSTFLNHKGDYKWPANGITAIQECCLTQPHNVVEPVIIKELRRLINYQLLLFC